jgi:Ser/Thr protein kinase RdoA (MazF antagonist)
MLKLRYLFDDRPLAERLLQHWAFDADDPERLKNFRISSNAVYPFRAGGRTQFLRFAPASEKRAGHVEAELDFIRYLRANGYPALEPVATRDGRLIVEQGGHVATVFARVPGVALSATDLSDEIVAAYGRALGELHTLSAPYRPAGSRRWSHDEVLAWCRTTLAGDPAAVAEATLLARHFASLDRGNGYGLIHYDFECDNVFWDAGSKQLGVIDFDDAMFHWYAMDIEQALDSLLGEVAPERAVPATDVFMRAYRAARPDAGDVDLLRPACRRFADLYWVARVTRSFADSFDGEPEWMTKFRARIAPQLAARSEAFGTPL